MASSLARRSLTGSIHWSFLRVSCDTPIGSSCLQTVHAKYAGSRDSPQSTMLENNLDAILPQSPRSDRFNHLADVLTWGLCHYYPTS
jgi:hypothetical protein